MVKHLKEATRISGFLSRCFLVLRVWLEEEQYGGVNPTNTPRLGFQN